MFRIKICGITNVTDALAAAAAGADAVGLNFYAGSPRCVAPDAAKEIAATLPDGVARVGVFVNADVQAIIEICDRLALTYVQLHGDEPAELVAQLAPRAVIKAFRLRDTDRTPINAFLAECKKIDAMPTGLLLDAHVSGHYGGTGATADWLGARAVTEWLAPLPVLLAGGLTPDNVAAAVAAARPWGVDTASGVEISPGHKDQAKMQQFAAAAREALAHG